MIQYLSIVLLLGVTASLPVGDEPKDGVIYDAKGKAGATFPAKPKLDADKNIDTYVLGENEDKQGYVLSIARYNKKADITNKDEVKKFMETIDLQLHRSLGVKPTKMTPEFWGPDKLPSRYYEFVLSDGGVYWSRVVFTGDRMVTITISGPKDWAKGEKAQAFLKSLKVEPSK